MTPPRSTQIVYYVAASLDGCIATAADGLDWLQTVEQPGQDYGYAEFYAGVDALVMGRSTYAVTRGFGDWPYPGKPAWVMTRDPTRDPGAAWTVDLPAQVQVTSQTPAQLVARWQSLGLKRVWLVGGGPVASTFLAAGLLDQLIVSVVPLVLGGGKPLFSPARGLERHRWTLAHTQSFASGLVQLSYMHAGGQPASTSAIAPAT